MKYKTGKLPAVKDPRNFKFASYFDTRNLPVPPPVLGHELIGRPWGMLANDKFGDCTIAGAAHEAMIHSHMGGGGVSFTDAGCLADYFTVTGGEDIGADMGEVYKYRRQTGVIDADGIRHKIDCYFAMEPANPEQLALGIYLSGAVGIGIECPDNIDKLYDAHLPWDVTPGTRLTGGHYVPAMLRNSKGLWGVVTWGGIQGVYQEFLDKYCDEMAVGVSLEILTARGLSPDGFGIDEIRRDLATL